MDAATRVSSMLQREACDREPRAECVYNSSNVSDSADADLVGSLTSGYRVLARVGSGTMGHVYEAEDVERGTRVALKILHRQHQKEFAPRFLREGKTLALLSHAHIVQLVDMGQLDDGALYLATELVPGISLRELMNQGPIAPARALAIMRQVLDALDAAHALGVVHRDIKPENIMLANDDGRQDLVKVLDFGVAKLLADTVAGLGEANLTSVGFSIFGSALYIAPESVTGQKIDARLDLYSVGAVLYEMLTGRPPFDHEDPAVLLRMQAFDPPPSLKHGAPALSFTPALEELVSRALAKQPDQRFASAADMIAALDAVVDTLQPARIAPTVDQQAPAAESKRAGEPRQERIHTEVVRLSRRHKRLLAVAAAVIVLAVTAFVSMRSDRAATASSARGDALAARARELVTAGKHREAMALLEPELTGPAKSEQASSFIVLGHARFALGRRLDALAAYERALRLAPQLGADKEMRTNLARTLEGTDSLATVLALDLLAARSPPDVDSIVTYAARGKLVDGRHRAVMLAEREGIGDRIDRIESWTLDLQQASTCEERKEAIERLADKGDRRALAALKRARAIKCVERQATDAIARIEGN
jgi:serine/threonine protein kinase